MFYADILARNTYRYTDIPIHIDCNRLTVQFQLRSTHTHTNTYNLANISSVVTSFRYSNRRKETNTVFSFKSAQKNVKQNKEKMEMEILLSKCAQLKMINKQI